MDTVRIGVVGLGGMGVRHARALLAGEVTGAALTAVWRRPAGAAGLGEATPVVRVGVLR